MIKYLGSKRTLLPLITSVVARMNGVKSVLDPFSGTSRVGHALKRMGLQVTAGDHNAYAAVLARCYVEADAEDVLAEARRLVERLNALPGTPGYFTRTFCERSRYLQPFNGARVDAIRDEIAHLRLRPALEAVMLVSLMEAADRVDSTTGVQMAFLKKWAARSFNPLQLRVPDVLPRVGGGACRAVEGDALDLVSSTPADLVYLDPPYNQHKYLGNYHVWETLVRWDAPEVYGTACKRVDCRTRKSTFNSRPAFKDAFRALLDAVRAPRLVVSFSNEGYLPREEAEDMLRHRGHLQVLAVDYRRYVGAQIGIHNPRGEKVGTVSHLRNTEFLYVVTPEPLDLRDLELTPPA